MSKELLRFGVLCSVLGVLLLDPGVVFAEEAPVYAKVYAAKVEPGSVVDMEELEQIAREQGSLEVIEFPKDGNPCESTDRKLVRLGEEGIGYPGFSVMPRKLLAEQKTAGLLQEVPGITATTLVGFADTQFHVQWDFPQYAGASLMVTFTDTSSGKERVNVKFYPEIGAGDAMNRPGLIRTVSPNGIDIIQVFDYFDDSPPIMESDIEPGGMSSWNQSEDSALEASPDDVRAQTWNWAGDVSKFGPSIQGTHTDNVQFGPVGFGPSFDFDTGWQPGWTRGAFPLQGRFATGMGSAIYANVGGGFSLNDSTRTLQAGAGSGYWEFDFGAGLTAEGSLYIPWLFGLNMIFPMPFVPSFDLRVNDHVDFSSYLLDSCAGAADSISGRLFYYAFGIPFVFTAGIGLDVALSVSGNLCGNRISVSDGLVFDTEGQVSSIACRSNGYHETAVYEESLSMSGTMTFLPVGCVDVFYFFQWCIPVFVPIPWTILSGPVDAPFHSSGLDFSVELRQSWYRDADTDGYGNPDDSTLACSQPAGYVADNQDCNDGCASCYPGAPEVCDGLDNDCNGTVPPEEADGDGHRICAGDCEDGNPNIHPGAEEICDGLDNDCEGGADEEPEASASCNNDLFCDGQEFCSDGSCQDGLDPCMDENDCTEDICHESEDSCEYPCNAAGWEDPCCEDLACTGDPVCEAPEGLDEDGDGYGDPAAPTCTYPEQDCDDADPGVNPGAAEICGNGVDDDCDEWIDAEDPDCAAVPWSEPTPAEASVSRARTLHDSDLFNHLSIVLLPIGTVLLVKVRRRMTNSRCPQS